MLSHPNELGRAASVCSVVLLALMSENHACSGVSLQDPQIAPGREPGPSTVKKPADSVATADRLSTHVLRALNKVKRPGTEAEITKLINRELDPGERPVQPSNVGAWLSANDQSVLKLCWPESRPRR